MKRIIIFLLILILVLHHPPKVFGESDTGGGGETFSSFELLKGKDYFYRTSFGDVYPPHPGKEAVIVGRDEEALVVYGQWPSFQSVLAFKDSWYILSVAVGDILPNEPGEEMVVGGWSEVVNLIWWNGSYHHRPIYNYRDWIYDIEVGDVDPRYDGEEILVVGETGEAVLLHSDGFNFSSEVLYRDPYLIDGAYIGDFDPTHPGMEIAVAGGSFNVTEIYYDNGWKTQTIWHDQAHIIELDGADLFPSHPGEELVLGGVRGVAVLVWKDNGTWRGKEIFSVGGNYRTIYDVDAGEGDLSNPGKEVLLSSWDGKAYMLYPPKSIEGVWRERTIFSSDYLIIGGEMGEIDPSHKGAEEIVTDSGGYVYIIYPQTPGVEIFCGDRYYLSDQGSTSIPIYVRFIGGYRDEVVISASFVEGIGDIKVSPSTIHNSAMAVINISQSRGGMVEVSLRGGGGLILTKRVEIAQSQKWFIISSYSPEIQVVQGYREEVTIKINGSASNITLEVPIPLKGVSLSPYNFHIDVLDGLETFNTTLISTSDSPIGTFPFKVVLPQMNITYYFSIKIKKPSEGDFEILLSPSYISLKPGENVSIDGAVMAVGDFSGTATLKLENLPKGIEASLNTHSIPIGGIFRLKVSAQKEDYPQNPVTVRVSASSGGKVRWKDFGVVVVQPKGSISLVLPKEVEAFPGEKTKINVTLFREGDFYGDVTIHITPQEGIYTDTEVLNLTNLTSSRTISLLISINRTLTEGSYTIKFNLTYLSYSIKGGKDYTLNVVVKERSINNGGRNWMLVYLSIGILISVLIILGFYIFYFKRDKNKEKIQGSSKEN